MHSEEQQPKAGERRARRIWLAMAIVALVAALVCGFWLLGDRRSADERLAKIEAGRAVPDAQNAALIYNELLEDPHALSLLDSRPNVLHGPLFDKRLNEPWRSKACPELAAWIDDCAPVLDKLVKASQFEACRFPISIDLVISENAMDRRSTTRQWTTLLRFAISNNLGEGRLHNAVTKWRCLIQMGNHLHQQPLLLDHITVLGTTRMALESMARFVATGEPSSKHLREIEAMPLPLADDWGQHLKQIRLIDRLMIRKMKEPFSLWDRLRFPFYSYRMNRAMSEVPGMPKESPTESTGNRYRQNIAAARGLRILVALRRYRNEAGHWPETLAEISSSLPETILTDPLNGGPFVYHQTGDTFVLCSRGRNKIDETVRRTSENSDDRPIWPPSKPKPKPKPASGKAEEMTMKKLEEIYGEDVLRDKE